MGEASRKLHALIAAEAFPLGGWLYCDEPGCSRGERITCEDAGRYLARGWPQHHGRTMTFSAALRNPAPPPESETP